MRNKISRRNFTKLAGATAIAVPALAQEQQAPAADAKPKYGMSKEQEDRVKQSVERGERGRGPLRSYQLSYSAEPSFIFRARVKESK